MNSEEYVINVFAAENWHGRKYFPWLREMLDRQEPVWHEVARYYKDKPKEKEKEWRIIRCTTEMVLVLSQIIYWNLPDAAGQTRLRVIKEGETWLAKSATEWAQECGITVRSAREAVSRLELFGLIRLNTLHFRGHPTNHIILDIDALARMVYAYRNPVA